jgi:hypothetical protein
MRKGITALLGFILAIMMGANPALAQDWRVVTTDNFIIHADTAQYKAEELAISLEKYHYVLNNIFKSQTNGNNNGQKYDVVLLYDSDDLILIFPTLNDTVAGLYTSCTYGKISFSTLSGVDEDRYKVRNSKDIGKLNSYDVKVLFHEHAHNFMSDNFTLNYPIWVIEGFAEYYSTMIINDKKVTIGYIDPERYKILNKYTMLPFKELITIKNYPKKETDRFKFYAQSWLLIHYIFSDPDRSKKFESYLNLINSGKDQLESWELVFGVPADKMNNVLQDHIKKGIMTTLITFNSMPEPKIKITEIDIRYNHLVLPKMGLKVCKNALTQKQIERTGATTMQMPFSKLVLARSHLMNKQYDEAITVIDSLDKPESDQHEAKFIKGTAIILKYRSNKDVTTRQKDHKLAARALLLEAYKLLPSDAPTLYYLSQTYLTTSEYLSENAVNAAIQASILSPNIKEYAFFAARKLVMLERMDEAGALLIPIANNPHNSESSLMAKNIIEAIEAKETKEKILYQFIPAKAQTNEDE